jgi:HAD superfamily hydrolase (TIGR01509 family)
MTTPQAVVFDLGKVLVDFDYRKAAAAVAKRGNMTPDKIIEFFAREPYLMQYETGLLSSQQFHQHVCRITGYADALDSFVLAFGDIFSPIPEMIELHATLRKRGVRTYIFSNTNPMAVEHLRRTYPFFDRFDGYILSYEHRAMKPDPKLYSVVERVTGHSGPALLYLDDRPENVETANARGWHGIVHTSPTASWEAMNTGLV